MIEAQNEYNKCLTAEAEGFGIGFMSITTDVNVELLNECYELGPFHGLCVPHSDDVLNPPVESLPEENENTEHESILRNKRFYLYYIQLIFLISLKVPEVKHKLSDAGILDS